MEISKITFSMCAPLTVVQIGFDPYFYVLPNLLPRVRGHFLEIMSDTSCFM